MTVLCIYLTHQFLCFRCRHKRRKHFRTR